jgi:serine/threonine-protein kinase HipA
MNCLCCGKPLRADNTFRWHRKCIKDFFGTGVVPKIDISDKTLELIVSENVSKGLTVPGVQKKLSLHLFSKSKKPRLTIIDYPTGYILKPQVSDFRCLPEAEQLVMCMADECGISTVPHALISDRGSYAYITKRVDRVIDGDYITRLAMEDFCQLDLRLTQDKYKGSYERCAKIVERYSLHTMLDMAELFMRLVFSFIVGNSDMHLKNFSLVEKSDGSNDYVLSPAYDLLPVNVIMPEDKEELALTLNGKKNNIRKKDFLVFADSSGISRNAAEKMIGELKSKKQTLIDMCRDSLLPEDMKESFSALIEARCSVL